MKKKDIFIIVWLTILTIFIILGAVRYKTIDKDVRYLEIQDALTDTDNRNSFCVNTYNAISENIRNGIYSDYKFKNIEKDLKKMNKITSNQDKLMIELNSLKDKDISFKQYHKQVLDIQAKMADSAFEFDKISIKYKR